MLSWRMVRVGAVAVAIGALAAAGCDAGGLLVVEKTDISPATPGVLGPSVTDFVSAGTVATNGKYKLVFTTGQATPNQGVVTSTDNQLNGGIVGAMNGN